MPPLGAFFLKLFENLKSKTVTSPRLLRTMGISQPLTTSHCWRDTYKKHVVKLKCVENNIFLSFTPFENFLNSSPPHSILQVIIYSDIADMLKYYCLGIQNLGDNQNSPHNHRNHNKHHRNHQHRLSFMASELRQ
jgi:hypothetical protein